jgi:single-stranded-DNA-specific exonuclease
MPRWLLQAHLKSSTGRARVALPTLAPGHTSPLVGPPPIRLNKTAGLPPEEPALRPVTKQWHLLPHDQAAIERLGGAIGVAPIVAQLLLNRGIHDASTGTRFLESPLPGLYPPHALPGITAAVERLAAAIEQKKKICIYGDYDVDGVTGTAILYGLLQQLGAPVEFYVPRRLEEGYGLNTGALQQVSAGGAEVVITVDCGICSLVEALEARRLNLELIVTDHHEMKDQLPAADVLVHPRLPGTAYPFGGLSGAGVAFKLAWALATKVCGSEKVTPPLREFLLDAIALATLGLIADVVPLHDENRILVRHGLHRLRQKPPLGVQALLEAAGIPSGARLRAEDISFKLAPRLNAAGRLGYAGLVVDMLTTSDAKRAREVATCLEGQNGQRQTLERHMTHQAREMLAGANLAELPAAVLSHPEWHPGVIGIVAGRLVEDLGRPVLIIAPKNGAAVASGSGRSIPGFALHEALKACDDHLLGHGGHAMAAGFKIAPERIDPFREQFCEYVAQNFPGGTPPAPQLVLDAEVPLSALTPGLMKDIDRLEPYGAQNSKPRFLAGGLQIVGEPRRIGGGERHLTFRVKQETASLRAVAFGMGDRVQELMADQGRCCLAFTPMLNEWMGNRSVELQVVDFQPGPEARLG